MDHCMPWDYVSDFDSYVGFRCSKKVEKHWSSWSTSKICGVYSEYIPYCATVE